MVHRRENHGWGRAVLSFGDGEEGAQWGPIKSGSAEFMMLFFYSSLQISFQRGNLCENGVFVFIDFF